MEIYILLLLLAYLLGSIPSAVWIGKAFYGIDVREHGSGNAGATNTFRVIGKKAGLIVFLIDFIKGFVAVFLLSKLYNPVDFESFSIIEFKIVLAIIAVIGHIFPIFAKFKGGKGVATLAGAIMGIYPPAVLLCLATFFIILIITHFVSLSSMISGVMFPIYTAFVFQQTDIYLISFGCFIAVLLIISHRKNIKRLLSGTESKIYLWKKKDQ